MFPDDTGLRRSRAAGPGLDSRRSRLLLLALVLAHLVVISQQVDTGRGTSLLERLVFSLFTPLQTGVSGLLRSVSAAWRGYADLRGVREQNLRLNERVRILETLLMERQHQAREAERLRELLELRQILPFKTIVAEVVTRDNVPWYRTLLINKGAEDGVRMEAPVISPTGVVGRVIERGPHAAKVQLLLDQQSGVGVLIERSRATGVVSGQVGFADTGTSDLKMNYVPELADVAVGDVVVTSGFDRIFPKGLVVGRVRFVGPGSGLFKEVLVSPSARFSTLEEVLILLGTSPDEPRLTETVR
jgi:rod shape-determining protein MreC